MRRFRLLSVLSATFFVLVAGCVAPAAGSEQSDAAYQPEASRAYSERHGIPYYDTDPYQYPYHPCVEIPPDVIEALGHDPASGERDTLGRPNAGWRTCTWTNRDPWFSVSIASTSYTLADWRANAEYHEFETSTIHERPALQARWAKDTADSCHIAIPAAPGMAMMTFSTGSSRNKPPAGQTSCSMATHYLSDFEPYLPAAFGHGDLSE
ncbi:DUF3558 domain-containing protein [Hoyosella subflava]|uniref:DUF3558 domain-containing protein n=1 Tax=Hoyosella subflava (strain DSM 45089 / JCM 17490 / NBRC 109087 / DQS3-9A1) TaxID=443218 RepID=F6EIB3_HOYSD|nr:DUF3558 domain-containing protein [Hoyosella subflava]AEF41220.1 hypothetical protein AS9A_2773 [Hoyosella subflava DQS3-9A1]